MKRASGVAIAALVLLAPGAAAQRNLSGYARVQLELDKLSTSGSALMIAAHPDDENTALLAWLARGRKVRTGYLSLTRGEGGQNLIGPEQGKLLGVIRTQELLAARRIDGAEQFFTSAVDFGYTKTVEETFSKWGRDKVLGDVVWTIRKFRPDVIILRFSGTPRDGHGQHQASAILGKEAFFAAADPKRFPEQLKKVQPWQAKRLLWNAFSFTREQDREAAALPGRIEVDLGEFDPLLGYSYAEIAGMSRSEHRSQGMGSPERRGSLKNFLVHIAGDRAEKDLFDGIETRASAPLRFDPAHPEQTVEALLKLRRTSNRRGEISEAIALATGLWLDANAENALAVAGSKVRVTLQAVNRSSVPMQLVGTSLSGPAGDPLPYNAVVAKTAEIDAASDLQADFTLSIKGEQITLRRPVHHRYIDKVRGELTRPFVIVPPVSVEIAEAAIMFPTPQPKPVTVHVRNFIPNQTGAVRLNAPAGWKIEPESLPYNLRTVGEETTLNFLVHPPASASNANVEAPGKHVLVIDYPHIEPQTVFLPASAKLVRADIRTLARRVGYIMGAGDEIPDSLRQIGIDVALLTSDDLAGADLSGFDAIVAGVRAYNTREDLAANQHRIMDYVRRGGTYVVQYNVVERDSALDGIGPYPMRIERERVSVEEAPVEILAADHPLLNSPNKVTAEDFRGWVQERGLYFASQWDPKYQTVLSSNDPGEKPLSGGMLYTKYGKGVFIFTSYSWFRQLPAGVPGAYRIFANLISAGKAQ